MIACAIHRPQLSIWQALLFWVRLCHCIQPDYGLMKTVRIVEQLAIFIANRPGKLADLCDALAEEKINIYGLTVSDTVDHAAVRMVVSDTRRAIALLEARGVLVLESEVLMIENDNRPGSLSKIAVALSKVKVNIEYAYLASMPSAKRGLLIIRVSDVDKASKVLQRLVIPS